MTEDIRRLVGRIHVLVAEAIRCLNDDKLFRVREKLDAIERYAIELDADLLAASPKQTKAKNYNTRLTRKQPEAAPPNCDHDYTHHLAQQWCHKCGHIRMWMSPDSAHAAFEAAGPDDAHCPSCGLKYHPDRVCPPWPYALEVAPVVPTPERCVVCRYVACELACSLGLTVAQTQDYHDQLLTNAVEGKDNTLIVERRPIK